MFWQHIFIPILPKNLIGYLNAPMPFLIGVPAPVMETVSANYCTNLPILSQNRFPIMIRDNKLTTYMSIFGFRFREMSLAKLWWLMRTATQWTLPFRTSWVYRTIWWQTSRGHRKTCLHHTWEEMLSPGYSLGKSAFTIVLFLLGNLVKIEVVL